MAVARRQCEVYILEQPDCLHMPGRKFLNVDTPRDFAEYQTLCCCGECIASLMHWLNRRVAAVSVLLRNVLSILTGDDLVPVAYIRLSE